MKNRIPGPGKVRMKRILRAFVMVVLACSVSAPAMAQKKGKKPSEGTQLTPLKAKPGVINKKGDKKLDKRFDPKTLGKSGKIKKPEDINVTKSAMVYSSKDMKYPCKKVPLDTMVSIDFQNVKLEDFTKIMACMTGNRYMLAQGVAGQITIMSPEPVTMYEAYKAFLSALEANNLTVVKRGKFYRIVPKVKARTAGAEILSPGRRAPRSDNVVTQLIPIKHVIADEVKELIQNFATDGADITVYNPTNTLIITEIGTNIARLRKLIRQVDRPTGAVRIWVRPVEFADAADIQKHVESVFGKNAKSGKKSSSRPARRTTTGRRGKNSSSPATGSALGGSGGELTVSADERTNQLIIITDRSTYLRVDKLIRKLDVPIPGEGQIHIHHLENADAKDVQSTLQSLASSGSSRGRRGSKRSSKRGKGKKSSRSSGGTAVLGGEVKITAHEPTNSLVIEANLKDYLVLQRVIRQLDIRRKQVYLESVIMEITSDKSRDVGLSAYGGTTFDVDGETVPLFFGNTLGPDISGLQDAFPGGFGAMLLGPLLDASLGSSGGGSSPSSISIPAFGFTLKALQSNSDVNILQTPHLLTTDNEEAEIEVGRKVPFNGGGGLGGLGALGGLGGLGGLAGAAGGLGGLGSLSSTLGAFSGLGTIQYADIKISLKIKPTVNESNFIRLEIEQQIDDFDGIDPATKAPNTSNRRVKNIVSVRDQQPVVIGGLMNDREIEGVNKIPILGDIPLLGVLFRQQTTKIQRKNLLMIIIPHIIDDPSDLKRIHEQRMEEIRNFADYLATRKKEYMGEINYKKKHGLLHEIHKVVEQAKKERYQLEQQNFEDSDLDPVGPADSHDLDYDPYQVEKSREGKADRKGKKAGK
ncbi:MAG TPA: type II secretion system protein GspD [Myxococcales bacterium]|nr:type II secretion system protein GspD [Myxococcales bacterium]HIN85592.1 type II secretion system protein GspD [Myxococcales bacterium]